MPINLDNYGTSNIFKWDHDYLIKVLTTGYNRIVKNPRLVKALKKIKREDFVSKEFKETIYSDIELDIGYGQKINRPTTVAYMLELLNPKVGGRVLEIGTGSGWTAALLAIMVGNLGIVYTIERLQYLIDIARTNIEKYKLNNIEFVFRDGSNGLPERAPFDAIYTSVAFDRVPERIKDQLNIKGHMIVPTTDNNLTLITRESKDKWNEKIFPGTIFDKIETGIH